MNILFLINYAGGAGTEKYVDNLQRIFSSEGNLCFLGYNIPGKLSQTFAERKAPSIQLDLTSKNPEYSSRVLAEYCQENSIDVIHTQFPVENLIAVKSLKHYSKPHVVLTRHLSDYMGIKWWVLNKIYTQKNHKIICVCEEAKENLIKSGVNPNKIEVIYNGVEYTDDVRENKAGDVFKLVICARYAKEKGLEFLLDSLAALKQKTDKKFECTILGEGEEFDVIKNKIIKLGLENEVIQAGYKNNTKEYLDSSNLYLNSSRSGEALSFGILEAMNSCLAVVATDVGGNSTLVNLKEKCGKIVNYGDTDGYSNAILEYINNPGLLLEHGNRAKEKIKTEFDLVKLAHDVYRAYE